MSRKGSLVCTGRLPFQILGVQKNKKQGVLVYERRIKKERKFAQNIEGVKFSVSMGKILL